MEISVEQALSKLLERIAQRRLHVSYAKLYDHSKPFGEGNVGVYRWQKEFHDAGADNPERALIAANRVGKSATAAAEVACHMTGWYPAWWQGRKFDHPVTVWTGCETNELSKDVVQRALLGGEDTPGTGWLPKESILDVKYRQAGVKDVVDTATIRHASGGVSSVTFKTYHAGKGEPARKNWQGTSRHVIWLDEEAPQEVYGEALTRILDCRGVLMQTFTPLLGSTWIVQHFTGEHIPKGVWFKNVTWDDAPHLNEDAKAQVLASYQEHERDTRTTGVPLLGSGSVFAINPESIKVDPFELPDHWPRINGCDFGIDHPAAGAALAIDRDSSTVYVYDGYKMRGQTAAYHANWFKTVGAWIPVAWPKDGYQRDKGSGLQMKDQYRSHGVRMLTDHAAYKDDRQDSVEASVIEMLEFMRSGKFKVFSHLRDWFEEMRFYHRDDGLIVKEKDDLLSATRYAFVMRRKAVTPAEAAGASAPARKYHGPIIGGRL